MFALGRYFKYVPSQDGNIAAAFLFTSWLGGWTFGWFGWWLYDDPPIGRAEGRALGFIVFYALSVGFGLSALRQPARFTRIWGGVTLFADLAFLLVFVLPVGGWQH